MVGGLCKIGNNKIATGETTNTKTKTGTNLTNGF